MSSKKQSKRPGPKAKQQNGKPPKRKRARVLQGEIESDSEIDSDEVGGGSSSEELEEETAQEKKLRLAKLYLQKLEKEEAEKEVDDISLAVSNRLKENELAKAGKVKVVADQYLCPDAEVIRHLRGHKHVVTCAVIANSKTAYSGSKDGSIIQWSLETFKRVKTVAGRRKATDGKSHTASILSMAVTSDGKFLASGDAANIIHIWNPTTLERIHTFRGHRQAISGLTFQKQTHQLFSGSFDRCVKVWDLDEMAYVETLYGQEGNILALDSLTRNRVVTAGADHHVHLFKVEEESTLRFNGNAILECVALINEFTFVTGSDDNSLSLWTVMKKKPIFTVRKAHGDDSTTEEHWITSVAACPSTDLVASGSKDGYIRFWKYAEGSLTRLFSVPVPGFVNSLQFSPQGDFLLAAVGKQHRLGSWWVLREAKNTVFYIPLSKRQTDS